MKLLLLGYQGHTGFGIVTEALATRFLDAGVDVRILAVNHRGEPIRGPLAGRVWPMAMMGNAFGGNITAAAITGSLWTRLDSDDTWKPDQILAISDVSGLTAFMGQSVTDTVLEAWKSVPVYHYCPIEGGNLPPIWRDLWALVQPVAMSDFGQQVISSHIGRAVPRIYHGVDTVTFRPVTLNDPLIVDGKRLGTKEACKAHFGLAGRKVIVRADRNVLRKYYDKLFAAFVEIARRDPDVDLLMHCHPQDVEGLDLFGELARLPEDILPRFHFTGRHDTWKGLSQDELVAFYNAGDVYVSTTGGEGFGLTLAESLACETPVVVTDWAADREVTGPGARLVPPLSDRYGEPIVFHSSMGMDWAMPDPRGFVEPVVDLLSRPSKARALGQEGRRHIIRSFSWDTAAAEFLTLFEESDARAVAS